MKLKLRKLNLKKINFSTSKTLQKKAIDHTKIHYLTKILKNLYLSDFKTVEDSKFLTKNKIDIIINLTSKKCQNSLSQKKFKIIKFDIADNPDVKIIDLITKVTNEIEKYRKLEKNIVVHCYKGISRAPTMIMAYLMLFLGMGFETAFEFVREKSPVVDPNAGFLMQLSGLCG